MCIAITLAALVIAVTTHATVPTSLADRVIAEADAIWKPTGLSILWSRQPVVRPPTLQITIGPARGSAPVRETDEPLGWIRFEHGEPQPQIYVSYANALDLLEHSAGVVGHVSSMPTLERDTYLSRAMGRALAHELGHYLLASREHRHAGLMKASRSAYDFFGPDHARFEMTAAERAVIRDRVSAMRTADADGGAPPPASLPRRHASLQP